MSTIVNIAFLILGVFAAPLVFIGPGTLVAWTSVRIMKFVFTRIWRGKGWESVASLFHTVMVGTAWVGTWVFVGWFGHKFDFHHITALQIGTAVGSGYFAFMLWAFSGGALGQFADYEKPNSGKAANVERELKI